MRLFITSLPYTYEYTGLNDLIVASPMTDRQYLSIMTAFEFGESDASIGYNSIDDHLFSRI